MLQIAPFYVPKWVFGILNILVNDFKLYTLFVWFAIFPFLERLRPLIEYNLRSVFYNMQTYDM